MRRRRATQNEDRVLDMGPRNDDRDRDTDPMAVRIEAEVAAGRMTLEEAHDKLLQHNSR